MKEAIVFDLDNTLLDTLPRHYQVYCEIVKRRGAPPLSYGVYVAMRANNDLGNSVLIDRVHGFQENVDKEWLEAIESTEMLRLDQCIIDRNLLVRIAEDYIIILLSLRSNLENAQRQLTQLGILEYFQKVIFLRHQSEVNPKVKALQALSCEWVLRYFVGDSGADFEASEQSNVPFVAVDTGLYKQKFVANKFPTVNHFISNLIKA